MKLEQIKDPQFLKQMNIEELEELAQEIRNKCGYNNTIKIELQKRREKKIPPSTTYFIKFL